MESIREYLVKELGEGCLESDEDYELSIPLNDGKECEAVFDPKNRRLKLYGITGSQFRRSIYRALLMGAKCVAGTYSKLIVYGYPGEKNLWHKIGLSFEGTILGFFEDSTNAVIWTAYQDHERELSPLQTEHIKKIEIARLKKVVRPVLRRGYSCKLATPGESTRISKILKKTFGEYPTPMGSRYIKKKIRSEGSLFRLIRNPDDEIVAVASAEIDHKRNSAELTDCATLVKEQRKGHMVYILKKLEEDLEKTYGITDIYSLARAGELSINCTFAKLGYLYTGRLFNNCWMPDGWESMNIWCKPPDLN